MEIKSSQASTIKKPLSVLKERANSFEDQESYLYQLNQDLKNTILDILYDLMYCGDISAAVTLIKNNKLIDGIEFTKRALLFGIERQAYERELISRLLSSCYELFNDNEIVDGFQLMLYRLPDIVLDVPHAPSILSKFISRAVYDEIIPPIFIKDAHVDNVKAKECMSLTFAKTHALDETKETLEHIWGPGDLTSVASLKLAVDTLLDEYLENPDTKETTEAFVELNVPSFFGEVIKRGLFKSIARNEHSITDFMNLLENWFKINLICEGHLKRGFSMGYSQLPNFLIDCPNAGKILPTLLNIAIEKKLIPADFKPIQ